MGLKRIGVLLQKDFLEFFSSKSWIVVLVLPLFVTFLFTVIYHQAESEVFTIAYHGSLQKPLRQILSGPHLQLSARRSLDEAKKALSEGKIDGILLNTSLAGGEIKLLVDKTKAKEMTLIVDAINLALVKAYAPKNLPQVKLSFINRTVPARWISLPIWLIQIILTVCLLQAAAAIADEKEKQTLHSLVVSPMTLSNYLLAKVFWNSCVGIGGILLTLALIKPDINLLTVLIFGFLGCLIYAAISILIGLFTPGALFARTMATLVYIISAVPLMLKDLSFSWKSILGVFPSYLVLSGLDQALLKNPVNSTLLFDGAGLILEAGLVLVLISIVLKYKADF
ncbi:MAG: ABC transporter permease [Bacillota bacterium]